MRYQPLHLCRLRHQRFSIARRSLIFRVITTATPIRNGKTNVAKRYNRDAEPAMPVPTIPAKSPVNTNSVEPIPAGAGITAASITDNAVIAMVSTRLIFLSPAKRRYGIPYQKQSFNRFKPITPATIFFLCRRYLEAASRSAHCSLNWCSNASYFPFLLKKSSIAKIS